VDIAPSQNFVGVFDGIGRELLKFYCVLSVPWDVGVDLIGSTNQKQRLSCLNARACDRSVRRQQEPDSISRAEDPVRGGENLFPKIHGHVLRPWGAASVRRPVKFGDIQHGKTRDNRAHTL
jgi:hypothetical protein